jgi:hypothetical protein
MSRRVRRMSSTTFICSSVAFSVAAVGAHRFHARQAGRFGRGSRFLTGNASALSEFPQPLLLLPDGFEHIPMLVEDLPRFLCQLPELLRLIPVRLRRRAMFFGELTILFGALTIAFRQLSQMLCVLPLPL